MGFCTAETGSLMDSWCAGVEPPTGGMYIIADSGAEPPGEDVGHYGVKSWSVAPNLHGEDVGH